METLCKGKVLSGSRKEKSCNHPAKLDGYCIPHQLQKEYDILIEEGKNLCLNFFRGCKTILPTDHKYSRCDDCRKVIIESKGKTKKCEHDGCVNNTISEDRFCKIHERDLLYELEEKKIVKFCDPHRKCFEILEEGQKVCSSCSTRKIYDVKVSISDARKSYGKCVNCDAKNNSHNYLCESCDIIITKVNEDTIDHKISKRILRELKYDVINGASKRHLFYNLTQEQFTSIIIKPCFFCGFYSDSTFNSVDRIDNHKGYIYSNVITACSVCNMMRGTNTPQEFIEKLNVIKNYQKFKKPYDETIIEKFPKFAFKHIRRFYSKFKSCAFNRDIKVLISKEEFESIINKTCYICNILNSEVNTNSIDRYDSSEDYILSNCMPCCVHCNLMKKDMIFDDMIKHIDNILIYCDKSVCCKMSISLTSFGRGVKRNECYNAEEILTILENNSKEDFVQWAKSVGYSKYFTDAFDDFDSSMKKSEQLEFIQSILNELSDEPEEDKSDIKYITATIMVNMINNKFVSEVKELYASRYTLSSSFETEFNKLVSTIQPLSDNYSEQIKLCKLFMKKEKSRRESKLIHSKPERKIVTKAKIPVIEYVYESEEEEIKPLGGCGVPSVIEHIELPKEKKIISVKTKEIDVIKPTKSSLTTPKQWKTINIYEFIKADQEIVYKNYILENNEVADKFDSYFNCLVSEVKSSKSFDDVKDTITMFIKDLTKARTLKLLEKSKVPLDEREDREVYPSSTIAKLAKTNKLDGFKKYIFDLAEEAKVDIKTLNKQYDEFEKDVKTFTNEKEQIKYIEKFLTNRRAQRYRASHPKKKA